MRTTGIHATFRRTGSVPVLRILALALVYYVAARLSLRVSLVGDTVTPIWPPTGIAVVWLIFMGRSSWPGVALGALAANSSLGFFPAAGITLGNTLAPVVAVVLLERSGFRPQLDRLRDARALVFAAALGAMTISATAGTATLLASGDIGADRIASTWAVWWTGDAIGVLIFAPFLFAWATQRGGLAWRDALDAAVWIALLGIITTAVFSSTLGIHYLPFPILGWIAFRYPLRVAATAAMLASSIAVAAAVAGAGPFAGRPLLDQMVTLQVFCAAAAFTSFVLAAVFAERAAALRALHRAGVELESRVGEKSAALDLEKGRLDVHKNEFIATAAHELRTPATAINLLVTVLSSDALTQEEERDILGRLGRQSDRLLGLVDALLAATQLDLGTVPVTLEPVDVAEVVAGAVAGSHPAGSVTIVSTLPPPGTLALADPGLLEQAMISVLTNAFNYGGRNVAVDVTVDRGEVLIAVADDGPGVDPDLVPHLFERFRRTGHQRGAVGLGLSIVRGLVGSMGARIWYEAVEPHGARFVIALPAAGAVHLRPGELRWAAS